MCVVVTLRTMAALKAYKVHEAAGRYKKAEPFAKRALKLGLEKFDLGHETIGIFLNNLAELYLVQGRYAEVKPLYKRALAIS